MRVVTWGKMFSLEGDVVYSLYDGEDFPENVYIQYNSKSYKRVCDEAFPILKPDYKDCINHFQTLDKFNTLLQGKVSTLETTGDIYDRYSENTKIIIYDKEDISAWIDKLNSLNVNY